MATLKAELKEILTKYGIDPRDKSKLWDCHGTLVLYHRAYEIIAARERITFDPPVIIEARSADKIVAMLVTGHMGDRSEWSIGEAAPGNCKNSYVYAIAEKRAKDRVIAKLVGLAEHVYSEDEADEFKDGSRQAVTDVAPPAGERNAAPPSQLASNGKAAPAALAAALPPNPEEPPEVREARDLARVDFDRLRREFSEALTEDAITHEKRGIWARNTEAVARIQKHGGADAIAKLHYYSSKRLDELRDMFPAAAQ